MKKAQLEVSFNWIFVILAGGAILFFFMNVVNTQTDQGRETLSRTITVRMDSIFSALESSPNSVQVNDRLNFDMQFSCLEDGHSYTVNNGNARNYLESQILFSPHEIGSSRLITWTLKHQAPYPISNLLLVTDERTAYVFIGDDAKPLYDAMPEEFIKFHYTTIDEFEDQGHRKYVVVRQAVIGDSLELPPALNRKTSIVRFTGINSGNIEFQGQGDNNNNIKFYGREILFAAIITGDKDLFNCGLEKLKEKSKIMHEIMHKKSIKIRERDELSQSCGALYQDHFLNPMNDTLKTNPFDAGAISQIRDHNTRLTRGSCPTIY